MSQPMMNESRSVPDGGGCADRMARWRGSFAIVAGASATASRPRAAFFCMPR